MSDEESTDNLSEPAELRATRSPENLTTEQAAAILGVLRPTVIRLIDAGELDAHMVGTHRRVTLGNVPATEKRRRHDATQHSTTMTHDADELGLYP